MRRTMLAATIFIVALFVRMAAAQPLADRVPADALVYVGWSGAANLGPSYDRSHLKAVLDASDFPKLFTDFLPRLSQRLGQENATSGEAASMIAAIGARFWRHPSAFYFGGLDYTNPRDPQPRIAILCDAGDEAAALTKDLQTAIDHAGKTPTPVRLSVEGQLVVITVGTAVPVPIVKGRPSLQGDATFIDVMGQLHQKPVAAIYVNTAGVVKAIDAAPARGKRSMREHGQWVKVRDALGLASARGAGWTGAFEGQNWSSKVFLAAPSPRVGVFTLFDAKPVSDDTLKLIPATATMAGAGTLDLAKTLGDVRSTAGKVDPTAPAEIDKGLDRFRTMTGLDLQKDVLEPLGDQWAFYSSPQVAGTFSLATCVVNKLRDPAKAESSLQQLSRAASNAMASVGAPEAANLSFRDTTVGDLKIHYLALPIIRPSWAIRNGVLYVAAYPQVIASAARYNPASDKSILDNESFAALRKQLGQNKATSVRFTDLPKTAPAVYPMWLFMSGYTGFLDIFVGPSPAMMLPPLDQLIANLGPAGSASWVDDAGWHMNGVSPFPGASALGTDPTISAMPPVMLSILLPSLNRARETANRVNCASNERQIGQAILLYANENKGKYPPDLGTLIKTEDITVDAFTCPSSDNNVPAEVKSGSKDVQATWANANSSYIYVGQGMNFNAPADSVLLYEKNDDHDEDGMNFLYGDGHVEWQAMEVAQQLIKNAGQKPAAATTK